jgi:hypothetical protein
MTTLITTSVVRGSQQGESHGGVYLLDLELRRARQVIDWNTVDIDWQVRGADRGPRGIAFHGETVFIRHRALAVSLGTACRHGRASLCHPRLRSPRR